MAAKAELIVLHVVEVPVLHHSMLVPVKSYETAFINGIKSNAARNFDKLVAKWGKGVKVSLVVQQGPILSTIEKFVVKNQIDLVVMGTHGSSGVREFALGSNAEKMIRASIVPVLSIKQSPPLSTLRNIIFPTDLDDDKGLHLEIKLLQKLLKAQLHILYINTPHHFVSDKYTEQRLKEFTKQNQFRDFTVNIYNDVDEVDGIIHFSSRFKSRIVTMSTHGRKGLNHALSGSIAEDVVNHIDCPVWTLSKK